MIDSWHDKWNRVITSLLEKDEYVLFSISGGKDSRVSLGCLMMPQPDMKKVKFFTAVDTLYTHSDDYRIASQIANIYGFKLNDYKKEERYKMDPVDNLNASLLVKCGFHRELMFTYFWRKFPVFRITGSGGDLRDLWNESAESFIKKNCDNTVFNSIDCQTALKEMMLKNIRLIDESSCGDKKLTANDYFYKQGRQRNHNGKANAESFLSNEIIISPLMDPVLYKLNQDIGKENDHDLLYTVIYERFLPELKNVPFDSKRIIKKETLDIAQKINAKYPYQRAGNVTGNLKISYNRTEPDGTTDKRNALDYLKESFYSEDMKQYIYSEFGEEVYNWADKYYKNVAYHPYMPASALVQIYTIDSAVKTSKDLSCWSSVQLPGKKSEKVFRHRNYINNGIMKEIFDYLQSGRIEIKNYGLLRQGVNEIVVDSSNDEEMFIEIPRWFEDDSGKGMVIQSCKGNCEICFRTIGDGRLKIKLNGPWIKGHDDKPLSIKIDFVRVMLIKADSGKTLIDSSEIYTVDSERTKSFEVEVKNGEGYKLYLEWLPFIYEKEELGNLFYEMSNKSVRYFQFWHGRKI